jgi:hypothetical protein
MLLAGTDVRTACRWPVSLVLETSVLLNLVDCGSTGLKMVLTPFQASSKSPSGDSSASVGAHFNPDPPPDLRPLQCALLQPS